MKILIFSDNHASVQSGKIIADLSQDTELLISAGDFSHFGSFADNFFHTLSKLNLPLYLVSGNHENSNFIKNITKTFSFIKSLEYRIEIKDGIAFYGCNFLNDKISPNSLAEKLNFLDKSIKKSKCYFHVFVTHCPPHNSSVGTDVFGRNGGSKIIRNFIEINKPDLVLCGHIHQPMSREDWIGNSKIMNIACEYKVIDTEKIYPSLQK